MTWQSHRPKEKPRRGSGLLSETTEGSEGLGTVVYSPPECDVLARFVGELELATLVRGLCDLQRKVALSWNALVRSAASADLKGITVPSFTPASTRVSWDNLPASFLQDLNEYLAWCRMPDPLEESARARALAPRTLRLRREQIHSAVTAAVAAGIRA
jgi:hypothetical protein